MPRADLTRSGGHSPINPDRDTLKAAAAGADAHTVRAPRSGVIGAVAMGATAGAGVPATVWAFGASGGGPEPVLWGTVLGLVCGGAQAAWLRFHVNRRERLFTEHTIALSERLGAAARCGFAAGLTPVGTEDLDRASTSASAREPASARAAIRQALDQLVHSVHGAHVCGSLTEGPGDVLVVLSRTGTVTAVSEASSAVLGWTEAQLRGQTLAELVHTADLRTYGQLVDRALSGSAVSHVRPRIRVRSAQGSWPVLEWRVSARPDPDLVVLAARDVTGQVQMEADLLRQATHDTLTGLPNRSALMTLAAEAVRAAGPERPLSVLMIDLDRFKDVNDSLGHAVGDQLLAQVGPRLRTGLRPSDTIARLGGDEFAVLLPTAGQDGAARVAQRLAEELETPFVVDGMDLHVEASIGIAVSHRAARAETTTIEGLLREADIAMYRAKEDGSGIASFDPDRDGGQSRSRLELSSELRRGLNEGQLVLHYQPLVDVVEGRLAGVEALVRWQHPVRGLLAPAAFLPLAEQTGLIIPLSKLVLSTAIRQTAAWQRDRHLIQIAVNLSPRWLLHADVPEIVGELLDEYGVPPELLRLEITESVVLAQPEHALGVLTELREMGIGLSLDDFGTGYSSMSHLRNLPVDELKVDRGFVHAMTTSPQDAVIVRAAIELGHNLGMSVVAEGIEDADTLAEVVAAGCSLAQGYYFAKPMPPGELISWATERFPGFGSGQAPAAWRRTGQLVDR